MTTTTRRKVIAGAAALPLLPVSAFAQPGNATDAAWSAYTAAKANYETHDQAYHTFEAAVPVGPYPRFCDFEDHDQSHRAQAAWERRRAQYPANPFNLDDDALDALCEPINDAERAVLSAKPATLTDIERKLAVVSGWNGGNDISAELVDGILADVRALMGVPS